MVILGNSSGLTLMAFVIAIFGHAAPTVEVSIDLHGPDAHGHDADGATPRADQREGGGALLARQLAVELVAIVLVLPSVAARAAAVDLSLIHI